MYCLQVLHDLAEYSDAIDKAKEKYAAQHSNFTEEVKVLKIEELSFDRDGKRLGLWSLLGLGKIAESGELNFQE
jgi:hypothetical protein